MRALVQRVIQAKVEIHGQLVGSIENGLLVFLGIHKDDLPDTTKWMVNKIVNLRIFGDDQGKMNRSLKETAGSILIVSQFTLYANCSNGRRPDFFESASGSVAEAIYDKFVSEIKKEITVVQTGKFGGAMQVYLVNDGPVTLLVESL
jgi:D-tyrosyl-tRNA(Tyr) deacylase